MKRSSHTKADILEAAQRQFAMYGFAKVTMDEIAADIGMGKASLYYYFPTKEKLFIEVIYREHDEFMANVSLVAAEDICASAKLTKYAEQRFHYFNKLINLSILEARASMKTKPMLKEMFTELRKRELRLVQKIIREGKATGEFQVQSVELTSLTIMHIMQGLRQLFLRGFQREGVEDIRLKRFRKEYLLAVQMILHGISVPAQRR